MRSADSRAGHTARHRPSRPITSFFRCFCYASVLLLPMRRVAYLAMRAAYYGPVLYYFLFHRLHSLLIMRAARDAAPRA